MPRKARQEIVALSALYHIVSRGNNQRKISGCQEWLPRMVAKNGCQEWLPRKIIISRQEFHFIKNKWLI